jgi:hypothetical protein
MKISIFILLILLALAPLSAFAIIGPEPQIGAPTDYTPPVLPSNVLLSSDGVKVIITWTDPPDADFYRIEILRNNGNGMPITGDVYAYVGRGVGRFEDTNVISGATYKYLFLAFDYSFNRSMSDEYSVTVAAPAPILAPTPTPPAAPEVPAPAPEVTPAPAPVPTVVTDPSNISTVLTTLGVARDEATESQYAPLVSSDLTSFGVTATETQKTAITNFVSYGISSATKTLGAGERRAVVRDYLETVARPDVVWSDIERVSTGQKPVLRNLASEQLQLPNALTVFEKIMGHRPDFKNTKEDLAWNTIMYRIRFDRDLAKEKNGIAGFTQIFKRAPSSPLDWAAVRALGYVL